MEIDTISYEETYSEVLKSVEWLSNQGFEHSKSRMGSYERTIKELVKTYKTESRETLNTAFPKVGMHFTQPTAKCRHRVFRTIGNILGTSGAGLSLRLAKIVGPA